MFSVSWMFLLSIYVVSGPEAEVGHMLIIV